MNWIKKINAAFGFVDDERSRQAQGLAVRNAYFVMLGIVCLYAAALETWGNEPGIFWPLAGVGLVSLLALGGMRLLVGGWQPPDERLRRSTWRVYAPAYFLLVIGISAVALLRVWAHPSDRSLRWMLPLVNVTCLSGVLVVFLTRLSQRTLGGHPLVWWVSGGLILAMDAGLVVNVGSSVWYRWQQFGDTLPFELAAYLTVTAVFTLGMGLVMVYLGCRRWQEEKDER